MEAGGGFIEEDERVFFGGFDLADVFYEFKALGFAAGEGIEGLAEGEVAEADFLEDG